MLRALRNPRALAGLALLIVFALMALLAPILAPGSPSATGPDSWLPPGTPGHPLGTTALGQDILGQLLWGARLSLVVGLVTGLVTTVLSTAIGLAAGAFGGLADEVLSAFMNVFLVLPALPLVIVIAGFVKLGGVLPVIVVVSITGWAWGARVLRSQTLSLRNRDFVLAARLIGESPWRIVFAEVLPNMVGLVAATFFSSALYAVLTEAGLEFLGVGDVSNVTWGTMLYWAQSGGALLRGQWTWIVGPGLGIALLGVAFALLNFAVDEVSNPRLRASANPPRRRNQRPAPTFGAAAGSTVGAPNPGLLEVSHLEAGYRDGQNVVMAVRDVNLSLERGELLGVAGESGCGKSTLAFAAARLLRPPGEVMGGEVRLDGTDLLSLTPEALRQARWRDFSMVFQASLNALNPVLTLREQVHDTLRAHGVTDKVGLEERSGELMRLVSLPDDALDRYPHQLSGGMRQRAVIAIALALEPKLVWMDEPTTALDVVVQRSLLAEVDALRRRLGLTIVLITHDLTLLLELADRVAVMYAGEVVEEGRAADLRERPMHPYTRRLLAAFPPLEGDGSDVNGRSGRREGIPGSPPDLRRLPAGCPFFERCPDRVPGLCDAVRPPLVSVTPGHQAACHVHAPAPKSTPPEVRRDRLKHAS